MGENIFITTIFCALSKNTISHFFLTSKMLVLPCY